MIDLQYYNIFAWRTVNWLVNFGNNGNFASQSVWRIFLFNLILYWTFMSQSQLLCFPSYVQEKRCMTAYLIKIVAEIFCTVPIHDKVDVPNNCMVFISQGRRYHRHEYTIVSPWPVQKSEFVYFKTHFNLKYTRI